MTKNFTIILDYGVFELVKTDPIPLFHFQLTMVACFSYMLAAMAMVAHGLPHTDHDNGFVLDKTFKANLGKSKYA